mgnify:CR=1 FL=1
MKIGMVKQDNRLTPLHDRDRDNIRKLKNNAVYEFEVKQNRNLMHHRKFWAVLACVCANSERWTSPERLLLALKIKLGYFECVPGFDGTEIVSPSSISFSDMDQDKFSSFYSAALPILAAEIGVTVEQLEQNSGDYK